MKMEEFIPYFDKKVVVYFTDGTSRYGILSGTESVSYTHLRAHETKANLVCRLLLEKKNIKLNKCLEKKSRS